MAKILGIQGETELFLGIWGAKANTFRGTRRLFAGRRGDKYIIFRDQGSTDPPWGASYTGSLIHEHYTRECEFGNFDKIKNKNNTKKQNNTKTQKLLAKFLFK